jgi:hypothetical protein
MVPHSSTSFSLQLQKYDDFHSQAFTTATVVPKKINSTIK